MQKRRELSGNQDSKRKGKGSPLYSITLPTRPSISIKITLKGAENTRIIRYNASLLERKSEFKYKYEHA